MDTSQEVFGTINRAFEMDFLRNRLAIVTNASTDIGVAIVEKLVKHGVKVLGLDNEMEHLENISIKSHAAEGTFQYYITDLSRKQDIANAISWSKNNIGPAHVLINIPSMHFQNNSTLEDNAYFQRVFDVDFIGLNAVTKEVAKDMIISDIQGHIIFVNPQSETGPNKNVADCVRQSVEDLVEVLRRDLSGLKSKIKVTILRPCNHKHNSTGRLVALHPEDIAETISYILSQPPHLQIDTLALSAI